MPGWHAKTAALASAGKLQVLGIAQEQHPDRTALFMQWQQMKWPVLLDSLNLLGCKGIPVTLLIDEHGFVRFENPQESELATFLATSYQRPQSTASSKGGPERGSAEGIILWGTGQEIDRAISEFQTPIQAAPKDGASHFRLGVAFRKRHDSPHRRAGDFGRAIASWKRALDQLPSQYIWRRRIQQYGPRLDKPYSFYDWVHEARETIAVRGETPHPLRVEPCGSEFALPGDRTIATARGEHPDPDGSVPQDGDRLIAVVATAVPSTRNAALAYRVHLQCTPNAERKVHWTNDAGPLTFYPEEGEHYTVENYEGPPVPQDAATSAEPRRIEFEVRPKANGKLPAFLRGAAYYYVCEDAGGRCLFLRQPIAIALHQE